ncbi:ArdC family protein [Carboxylicivirga linearis]|uniref:DUF1738 domain-containing protein n=1 Tax=Carboxylicivirga linearis TaxID=1628157 RepID=A0ABS5JXW4_9BACT|nr:zincin-like metallopeptidase domain-containing protein [Carboxylicivirga linearis]MBS2099762.1 DUF1738 domain-containing protein [Carboxylicivirga linearis]
MKGFDIYGTVTNLIIDRLEKGVIPWAMPWKTSNGIPRNLISNKPYRGFNFWYLLSFDFEQPYFLTFNQAKELGAYIKKGAKSYMVIFWKMLKYEKEDELKEIPILRYYRVFHIDDIEGVDSDKIPDDKPYDHDFKAIDSCEKVVSEWKESPVIRFGKKKACYIPSLDEVHMPDAESFFKDEEFYSCLFHELVHSTGHINRLNRHQTYSNHHFGSCDYSKEELIAEMGAAYLCGICGIEKDTIDNSAAYIQGWLKKLRNDQKFIVSASSLSQQAVDYIIGE